MALAIVQEMNGPATILATAGTTVIKPGLDTRIEARTATGAITIQFPPTPGSRQVIEFKDADGQASVNNVTFDGNGNQIEGADTWPCYTDNASLTFVWVNPLHIWRLV